jgi:peroxiredoxin
MGSKQQPHQQPKQPTPTRQPNQKKVPELKAAGVDKVVCVTAGDPEQVRRWAADNGFDRDTALCVLADRDRAFMRLLGLELGADAGGAGAAGPPCQRFAAVVDNGVLLRLKVEAAPGDLKLTQVQCMLAEFRAFFPPQQPPAPGGAAAAAK